MAGAGPRPVAGDPMARVAALAGVPEAVARARAAVDAARGHPVLRRRGPEVAAESALRGARASAALEGAVIDLPALREAVRGGAVGSHVPGAPLLAGAVRVSAELTSLAPTWRHAPLQVLARLHVLAAADLLEPARLGRPRGPGDPVPGPAGPIAAIGPGLPPPVLSAGAALARLDQLARLLTAPSAAPALVVAAVAHGELLAIRAFAAADGLLARAVSRLVLITRGLDPASVTVPEVGHLDMGCQAYADALRGYVTGGAAGVARWVVHCADAVARGAHETSAFCDAMQAGTDAG